PTGPPPGFDEAPPAGYAGNGGSKELIVGARPEHLTRNTAGSANGVRGEVGLVEELGADSYIYAETDYGTLVARGGAGEQPAIGQTVAIFSAAGSRIHISGAPTQEPVGGNSRG